MLGTSTIRGCYVYNGYLVLLSNGELGTHVHRRRCKDLYHAKDKTHLKNSASHNVREEERH
jgi:hypothetical protein